LIPENIFRAYDIRGIYGKDLTEEAAECIGKAISHFVEGEEGKLLVGKDVRLSSEPLGAALVNGILSSGLNVEDIGIVTTPLLYFASVHYHRSGGVMITASHNPPEWNGFKIFIENSFISMGMGMEDLRDIVLQRKFKKEEFHGKYERNHNVIQDYINYVTKKISIEKGLKLIADLGSGSCTILAPRLFQKAGIDAISIYSKPNGTFSSHPPQPTETTLGEVKRLILEKKADFGVGFDADGDRAIFLDDAGRRVSSTSIFVILAENYLKRQPGGKIVYEVSCSMLVEETIKVLSGKPILSRVGHTYIFDKMSKEKAIFGGETSSHFYFSDVYGFDDALFASLKLAEILSKSDEKLSEIVDDLPTYLMIPDKSYYCPDKRKFQVIEDLLKEFRNMGYEPITLDGVKVVEDEGWFLIRQSNTQPLIRVTVEAKNEETLQRLSNLAEIKITENIERS
jgi:phosphomannomutase/phosphoglucomutase